MARTAKRDLTREQQLSRGPIDVPFLTLVLVLLGIGLVMLLSASSYYAAQYARYNYDGAYFFKRQLAFAVAGLAIMLIISRVNYRRLYGFAGPFLFASVLLLIAVLIPGVGITVNNATRWLGAGSFQFQPSEIAKAAVVLYFAARMSKRHDPADAIKKRDGRPLGPFRRFLYWSDLRDIFVPVVLLGVVIFLLYREPHVSAMILIICAAAAILFVAGVKIFWFVAGGGAVVVGVWAILNVVGYNSDRIQTWLDPWWDASGKSFQVLQSILAVASGGVSGQGFGLSRQKYLYLPEPENDVIFSVVCEELGFIGAVLIIALFALLVIRGYWLAIHARDRFGAMIIVGIVTLLAVQVFLNIAVVVNLIPATGISLPFFSYGGTALVIQLAEVGLVLSVSRQIPAPARNEEDRREGRQAVKTGQKGTAVPPEA